MLVAELKKIEFRKKERKIKQQLRPTETDNCSRTECRKINHTFFGH